MSSVHPLEKLKEDYVKIEEELQRLREQKKVLDEKFSSALGEEKKITEEMRKVRDPYQYNKMDMRLNMVSRSRREAESQREENERKIRGYEEELKIIKKRIEYLKPKSAGTEG